MWPAPHYLIKSDLDEWKEQDVEGIVFIPKFIIIPESPCLLLGFNISEGVTQVSGNAVSKVQVFYFK